MKLSRFVSAALAAVSMIAAVGYSADAPSAPADPSGSWTFQQQMGGRGGGGGGQRKGGRGGAATITLTLTLKDGNLTGTVSQPGRGGGDPVVTDISDASFKDGTVTFSVVREFNDNKIVTKYSGKLDGDTITGTVLAPGRGGADPTPRDWVAKRSPAAGT
jgi:hypothetical protein